jgi:hypothetical protein
MRRAQRGVDSAPAEVQRPSVGVMASESLIPGKRILGRSDGIQVPIPLYQDRYNFTFHLQV